MTKEQTEHVYEAVANGKQVNPLVVNSRVDELSKVVNPYTVGLRTDADSTLKKEPSSEMKKCDLTWSILSKVVDYSENDKSSSYKEVNHSPVYSRFENAKDLIIDEQSNLWDERFEEVSCNLYNSLMTPMMLALLFRDILNLKVKGEPFQSYSYGW